MATKNTSEVVSEIDTTHTLEKPATVSMNHTGQSVANPQVKATRHYTPRRSYDPAYKARILLAYEACESASARGELLRREGLYHSRISDWKHEQAKGTLKSNKCQKGLKITPRVDHLLRENEHLKKKLAHAEAIIDLQKKVSELLGMHILPHEKNEV